METDTATDASDRATPALRSRPMLHYKELSLGVQNKKVKFTCVHASDNFLVCGANNGSVYLYVTSAGSRAETASDTSARAFPAKYHLVKTIAPPGNNDRVGVSCVSICPLQKRLVVGTMGGVVYGIQLTDYNKIGEKVEFSHDFHTGFPVTCFVWDRLGMKLYSACNGGMVALTTVKAGMSAFFGKADTELLLKEETGVVQLDMTKYGRADILMVSSQMRVLLLNLSSTEGSAVQIGTKARQGNFGACFFTSAAVDEMEILKKTNVNVFSARPGRRVWVADPQTGTVSATLKFALSKNPSTFLQSPECQIDESIQSRDLTINKMALFQFIQDPSYVQDTMTERSLLVSWNTGSSVLFFLDPVAVEIVEWHLDLGTIHDLKVLNDSVMVILHGETPKVSVIQSCSARQFLDLYGGEDVKKSIEMAVEYRINDAPVLETLNSMWRKTNETKAVGDGQEEAVETLSTAFDALLQSAKELEERRRGPDLTSTSSAAVTPLQVIFKQRPQQQQQQQQSTTAPPDLFASNTSGSKPSPGKPMDYLDVRTPPLSYRRNISAPDGSTLEARMTDIKELPVTEPIVRDDYRAVWMEEILEEVRQFEVSKAENDGAMNNLLPTLRGTLNNTGAAAKAITTYIPGANMISNFMDTAANINYTGRGSAINMFGEFPDADTLVLDPIVVNIKHARLDAENDAHECAVLRIAMSSTGEMDTSVDTEVLLEAISMDIWDSKLKYVSNLPLDQQLNLPEAKEEDEVKKNPYSPRRRKVSTITKRRSDNANVDQEALSSAGSKSPLHKSKSADSLQIDTVPLSSLAEDLSSSEMSMARRLHLLNRRSSLSPATGRSAQRALQRYIGGGPSCDFQRKCLVSGQLATSPELDLVLKREVSDLLSELSSAAATAEKTARLTRRMWPAAGITRVCGCLTNMFLIEGDLVQAQKAIYKWLLCFDPLAKPEDQAQKSPAGAKQNESSKNGSKKPPLQGAGFARGEALLDGDGLPLTRNDWTLVRVMVSTYFAISTAGMALQMRAATLQDFASDTRVPPYAYEMGIILQVGQTLRPTKAAAPTQWSAKEAEQFVKKYGIYLNTELAAEICSKQQMDNALHAVLDQVVSSSNMSSTCDDVVNWIVEKQISKALECLKDMDSLCLVLHVLDLLLKKCPEEAVNLCVAKFPSLTPWNVERCLFGAKQSTQELLKHENAPQTATYFGYLVRLLEAHGAVVGCDKLLMDRCLQLCFGGAKIVGKTFADKQKRHNDVVSWVCSILRRPEVYTYDDAKAWELCVKNHMYPGLLELTYQSLALTEEGVESERRLDLLIQLIVEKKELLILQELLSRSTVLPEETATRVTTKILRHIESNAEKGDDDELITTVVHALLNAVGPSRGIQELRHFPLLFAASPLSMYQTIVEAHLLSELQQEQVNQLLEAVDSHVWATYKEASRNTSVTFAPQVQAVFDLERRALKPPLDSGRYEKWKNKQTKYEAELVQQLCTHDPSLNLTAPHDAMQWSSCWDTNAASGGGARQVARSFEFRSSDWGGDVQLHDAACAVCDLPVVIIADDNCNMEVALLPCGHAFHIVCITDTACAVCFESNFETLL